MQKRLLTSAFAFFITLSLLAWGKTADYTDDAPSFMLPFPTALLFSIGAVVLFGIANFITDSFRDEKGDVQGFPGTLLLICNIAMIICAMCGWYIVWIGVIILVIIRAKKGKL